MNDIGVKLKKAAELQFFVKGFSNKHRIRILFLLSRRHHQSVQEIADQLGINFRTASEHTRRMRDARLILKKYNANEVEHTLTPLGKSVLNFLKSY